MKCTWAQYVLNLVKYLKWLTKLWEVPVWEWKRLRLRPVMQKQQREVTTLSWDGPFVCFVMVEKYYCFSVLGQKQLLVEMVHLSVVQKAIYERELKKKALSSC